MTTVEDIVSGMEYQDLTAINSRPNYENVNTIRPQIYANAASVDSLRGGPHGHLGQIMMPATYLTVTETPYNNPLNPEPLPPRPAAFPPQQWEDTKAAHKRALDEYNTSNNFDKATKQQIVSAIKDPIFLKPIENHITGFSRVTAGTMLKYLFNAYGNITPHKLDVNDKMMKEKWDPSTPIIYLFSKIQDGVDKADAGNAPYTVNQVLAITFNHVFHTGTMQSACERWTALAPMKKTWVNFQDMLTSAHDTYEELTEQAGGYHGANNVQAQEMEKFYNETAEAFANLAMAATADKDLLSTLTNTNSTLTNQLATKDRIMTALQEQLRNSRSPNMSPAHRQPSASDKAQRYCWTHSIRVSSNHNSSNCTNPGEGNKSDAT
jgi:uncharacterized membrane-anchored protein YhcB (DUF1043 family)